MRTSRRLVVLFALALLSLGAAAAPAGAGRLLLGDNLTPTSGPPGTSAQLTSIDPCPQVSSYTNITATLTLVASPNPADVIASTPINGDGSWMLPYSVPGNAAIGSTIDLYVRCWGQPVVPAAQPQLKPGVEVVVASVPAGAVIVAEYGVQTFTVTAPPTTTTTSTTTSTTTTTQPTTTTTAASTTTLPGPSITASPTTMYQGDTIDVVATGYQPGATVVITLASTPTEVGSAVADLTGRISTQITVPISFPTGAHTLSATGAGLGGATLQQDVAITVLARATASITSTTVAPVVTTGTLPTTGSNSTLPLVATGLALVGVGGAVAVVAGRRRRALS